MVPARPNKWLRRYFAAVVEGRFKKTFHALHVRGLESLRDAIRQTPLLFVSNHTAWWDPMFLIYLSTRIAPFDGYAMMEAKNLKRLPFLGRLGGFGVDLDDGDDRRQAIDYAVALLDKPGRGVWIFPQGRERAISERPLGFKPGAAVVATRSPASRTIAVAFRYEFASHAKPEMWVSLSEPFTATSDVETTRAHQERAVVEQLAIIDDTLCARRERGDFATLWTERPNLVGLWMERWLAALTRYR
jgi:hypothetical protein